MAKKTKRFKRGGGASSGSVPLQSLNYNLLSGSGRGGGGDGGLQLRPTIMRQPSSDLGRISGTAAPKGVGVQGTMRFKKGGKIDGCAIRGKTRGKMA